MESGIFSVFSVVTMCLGILFLVFALEELVHLNFLMASSYLACFAASITTSYILSQHQEAIRNFLVSVHDALYGLVLAFFKGINRRIGSRLSVLHMEKETSEHIRLLCVALCLVVLPASLLYVLADFYIFEANALDSMLWGLLIFFYSNFLPDLPSIYRRKKDNGEAKDITWYKKYALLLFAPLLIWAFYSGLKLSWRTTDTFHNFRSLTVYGAFLLLLSLIAFGNLPISIGDVTEIVFLPLCGLVGYLTHLKVDKVW